MKNERNFYKCSICGNVVGLIERGGGELVCCGKAMTELIPNTTDGAREKHVPVLAYADGKLKVTVGSVPHPMLPEHHISWILVAQGGMTQRRKLDLNGPAEAEFLVEDGSITVYEYCNIHGLWASEM